MGLRARTTIDTETILVESTTFETERRTSVISDAGVSYAEWTTQLADLNTVGSYAGRSFGRPEDMDTDMDPAYWQSVMGTHAEVVLASVSTAAQRLLDEGGYNSVANELATVALIGPNLRTLATRGTEAEEVSQGAECNFWNGYNDLWNTCRCCYGGGYSSAITSKPYSWCTRNYYVQIYDDNFNLFCGRGCAGCSAFIWACDVSHGHLSFCSRSKHWDSLNPGSPIWRHACRSCGA
jgi:hypothetical protein